ncbi:MAG: glycosyltransferase [Pirellulaceae bacterium]
MIALISFWSASLLVSAWVLLLSVRYARLIRHRRDNDNAPLYQPRARIVLCVRGADPFLARCIACLLDQDYPNFDVRVVVDRAEDPAWPVVAEALRNAPVPARMEALSTRSKHRSLKVTSLLQGIADLDESYEVVAIADADVIANRHWLRDLVQPLQIQDVGVTTGVRWYIPESSEWGTLIRYMWNCGAEMRRSWFGLAWGGSMAIRRDVFEAARQGRFWEQSFGEDVPLAILLRERGHRMEIVPEVIADSRESIGLMSCIGFISRQLKVVWLYHPYRYAIALETYGMAAVSAWGAAYLASAAWQGDKATFWSVFGALVTLGVSFLVAHFWAEIHVFQIVTSRGGSVWSPVGAWIGCFLAAPVVPLVNAYALLQAQLGRRVTWRGIVYRIHNRWSIEIETDTPYVTNVQGNGKLSA